MTINDNNCIFGSGLGVLLGRFGRIAMVLTDGGASVQDNFLPGLQFLRLMQVLRSRILTLLIHHSRQMLCSMNLHSLLNWIPGWCILKLLVQHSHQILYLENLKFLFSEILECCFWTVLVHHGIQILCPLNCQGHIPKIV